MYSVPTQNSVMAAYEIISPENLQRTNKGPSLEKILQTPIFFLPFVSLLFRGTGDDFSIKVLPGRVVFL